jgi:hypothetical protein
LFPLFATGVNNTRGLVTKFAAGVVDTGGNLPPVSLTAGGGKFANGVVDTGGAPLAAIISANFQKMVYSGASGKLIHEKNRSQKSRNTVPLRQKGLGSD